MVIQPHLKTSLFYTEDFDRAEKALNLLMPLDLMPVIEFDFSMKPPMYLFSVRCEWDKEAARQVLIEHKLIEA